MSNKTKRDKNRRDAQKADKAILVELPNEKLFNAFGQPFMLRNLDMDEQLLTDINSGAVVILDDDEEPEEDQEFVYRSDPRLKPLLHVDLSYTIQHFLRSRNTKTQEILVVDSQGDSDHIWDIGERLQEAKAPEQKNGKWVPGAITMSKSDHRWLLQKAKDLAHKAFPVDARMFIDRLDVVTRKESEESEEEVSKE